MLQVLLGWAVFARSTNGLFLLTYGLAAFSFLFALWRLRLSPTRRLLLAISFPFAFVQGFEIVYSKLGYLLHATPFEGTMRPAIILVELSWLLLGFSSFPFWRFTKKTLAPVVFFIGGFLLWAFSDYPQTPGLQPFGVGLALNIALKIDAFVLFSTLLYDGTTGSWGRICTDSS